MCLIEYMLGKSTSLPCTGLFGGEMTYQQVIPQSNVLPQDAVSVLVCPPSPFRVWETPEKHEGRANLPLWVLITERTCPVFCFPIPFPLTLFVQSYRDLIFRIRLNCFDKYTLVIHNRICESESVPESTLPMAMAITRSPSVLLPPQKSLTLHTTHWMLPLPCYPTAMILTP